MWSSNENGTRAAEFPLEFCTILPRFGLVGATWTLPRRRDGCRVVTQPSESAENGRSSCPSAVGKGISLGTVQQPSVPPCFTSALMPSALEELCHPSPPPAPTTQEALLGLWAALRPLCGQPGGPCEPMSAGNGVWHRGAGGRGTIGCLWEEALHRSEVPAVTAEPLGHGGNAGRKRSLLCVVCGWWLCAPWHRPRAIGLLRHCQPCSAPCLRAEMRGWGPVLAWKAVCQGWLWCEVGAPGAERRQRCC